MTLHRQVGLVDMQLFVSFSHDDRIWVYEFLRALQGQAKHEELSVGRAWAVVSWDVILTNIESCDVFVSVLSPQALDSVQCKIEIEYALALEKPVLALILRPISERFKAVQFLNIVGMSIERVLDKLDGVLGQIAGQSRPVQESIPRPSTFEEQSLIDRRLIGALIDAEKALLSDDTGRAYYLFEMVIGHDPDRLGLAPRQRIGEYQYTKILHLANDPRKRQEVVYQWQDFIEKYGQGYDPENLASLVFSIKQKLERELERKYEYLEILRLADDLRDRQEVVYQWQDFIEKYGQDYDPHDLASRVLSIKQKLERELERELERKYEYLEILHFANDPDNRQEVVYQWQDFIEKYGQDYDPENLASLVLSIEQGLESFEYSRNKAINLKYDYWALLQPPVSSPSLKNAHFTTYYPRAAAPNTKYSLYVYIHVEQSAPDIKTDVARFSAELGGDIPAPRSAKESKPIEVGTWVTVAIECSQLDFSPSTLRKKWDSDWVRYEFEFRPPVELVGEVVIARVSIQIDGIEIASIPNCAIEVTEEASPEPLPAPPKPEPATAANRLAAAKAEFEAYKSLAATIYHRIFISYSRKDVEVVRAYKAAQEALGNELFVDTESIHTGESWMARLALEIDKADIFQLFWSENSATSEFVTEEWQYALTNRCPEDKCVGFIRPVFWIEPGPNPDPPKELSHLHFRYSPLGQKDEDS